MSKLIGMILAGALAFAVSGFAYAADEPQPATQGQPRAEQSQPAQSGDTAKREQEYLTALKRCEPLSGADKQKCIDAAKKKYGEM
jgi:sugar phosphate permease